MLDSSLLGSDMGEEDKNKIKECWEKLRHMIHGIEVMTTNLSEIMNHDPSSQQELLTISFSA